MQGHQLRRQVETDVRGKPTVGGAARTSPCRTFKYQDDDADAPVWIVLRRRYSSRGSCRRDVVRQEERHNGSADFGRPPPARPTRSGILGHQLRCRPTFIRATSSIQGGFDAIAQPTEIPSPAAASAKRCTHCELLCLVDFIVCLY